MVQQRFRGRTGAEGNRREVIAVYRWGTSELVLICARADAYLLIPGLWYGRYAWCPLAALATPESAASAVRRLILVAHAAAG